MDSAEASPDPAGRLGTLQAFGSGKRRIEVEELPENSEETAKKREQELPG